MPDFVPLIVDFNCPQLTKTTNELNDKRDILHAAKLESEYPVMFVLFPPTVCVIHLVLHACNVILSS